MGVWETPALETDRRTLRADADIWIREAQLRMEMATDALNRLVEWLKNSPGRREQ